LQTVNSIIHPEVAKDYGQWLASRRFSDIVAHESAILYETGWSRMMDKMVTVYAPVDMRIRRVMARERTNRDAVLERINNQIADEEKARLSDYVIYNDENHSLIKQTLELIQCLTKLI
jgi:dephospho-CoA kinase